MGEAQRVPELMDGFLDGAGAEDGLIGAEM
jgi:hypothetical protein